MTPLIGFRTNRKIDQQGTILPVQPPAVIAGADPEVEEGASRAADYAYRIAAVTAGLVLLATVM
jgi:hypothetical protein